LLLPLFPYTTLFRSIQSFTYIITFLFIVLFIVFFLLKDETDITNFFKKITPSTLMLYVKEVQMTLHTSIFRFIKAQFLLVLLTRSEEHTSEIQSRFD